MNNSTIEKKHQTNNTVKNNMNTQGVTNVDLTESTSTIVDTVVEDMAISEKEVSESSLSVEELLPTEKPVLRAESKLESSSIEEEKLVLSQVFDISDDDDEDITVNGRRLFEDSDEEMTAMTQEVEEAAREAVEKRLSTSQQEKVVEKVEEEVVTEEFNQDVVTIEEKEDQVVAIEEDEKVVTIEEDEEVVATQEQEEERVVAIELEEEITTVEKEQEVAPIEEESVADKDEKLVTAEEKVQKEEEKDVQPEDTEMTEVDDISNNEIIEKENEKQQQQQQEEKEKEKNEHMDKLSTSSATEMHDDDNVEKMQNIESDMQTITATKKFNEKKEKSPGRPDRKSKTVSQPKKQEAAPKKTTKSSKAVATQVVEVEEDDEEPEYEVEKIIAHRVYKGKVVKYEVKWKGYGESENTMESANQMHDDIYDLCAAYWDTVKNIPRPSNAPVSKNSDTTITTSSTDTPTSTSTSTLTTQTSGKRKRSNVIKTEEVPEEQTLGKASQEAKEEEEQHEEDIIDQTAEEEQHVKINKKMKRSLDHVPQYMLERGYTFSSIWPNSKTKWHLDMKRLSAVQLSPTDKNVKMAYIDWNNGEKTIHPLEECHKKCPETLINYYEERLRFV